MPLVRGKTNTTSLKPHIFLVPHVLTPHERKKIKQPRVTYSQQSSQFHIFNEKNETSPKNVGTYEERKKRNKLTIKIQ